MALNPLAAGTAPASRRADTRRDWRPRLRAGGASVLGALDAAVPVRLLQAEGGESTWLVGRTPVPATGYVKPLFVAVEIPEALLLQRRVILPRMTPQDMRDAVMLEARTHSPFAAADLVWGFVARDAETGSREVDLAMASRRQVEQFIATRWPELAAAGQAPEAWALAGPGTPVVISGFGEAARLAYAASQRRVHLGLLGLAVALAAAVLLTPTAQLRLRAMEAANSFSGLASRSAPLVRKRDELVLLTDQVRAIERIASDHVDPSTALEYLTRVLPDDTYLYSLDIKGSKVVASGHTVDASALLQRLSADPRLRNVRSPTAVTRQPGATKEAFTVEFTLEPPPATAAAPAPAMPPGTPAAVRSGSSPFVIGGSSR